MLSIIESICVEKKKWITHDDMMNITVIAESTPGPIAINLATFVGYKKGKTKLRRRILMQAEGKGGVVQLEAGDGLEAEVGAGIRGVGAVHLAARKREAHIV